MADKDKEHKNNNKENGHKHEAHAAGAHNEKVTLSGEEYAALKAKADERDAFQDKYVRAHAEFENIRRRLEKEKADFTKYANEGLVFELLPIIDNLEIAEKYIKEAKDFNAVREGVDMIQSQIQKFLKDIGLERLSTVGAKFDPHLHDPIETEESNDKDDGIIVAELKPGYNFNGKLLRPASVRINKKKEN